MKKKLLLFPFGGNTRETIDCINFDIYDIVAIVDDDASLWGQKYRGIPVSSRKVLLDFTDAYILATVGNPNNFTIRDKIIKNLNISKNRFVTIIHHTAVISETARIGINVLIMAGVVISCDTVIEDNVIILPNSVIHHDSKIMRNCLIGSNVVIAGNVTVEKNCYIGSKSSIKNDLVIGENCLIGIGSNVVKSQKPDLTIAGNPAKVI